jgi:NADPH-dependent 2,4-dienoyl-CoA reductase/sulfur reductase-like enzyme
LKKISVDIAVIGGGPAGMAAALEANRQGVEKIVILERDFELGGILPQCIHDGFGLLSYGKSMTGCGYAQKDIDEIKKTNIQVFLNTMVLEITPDKIVYACSSANGIIEISCGAIILAMGCRERTAGQILLHGYRPQGVLTAGSVQRYINIEGYLPGTKAVILGSGDIGLIMARRMTLEGIEVKGVYEVMPYPGGLTRNIVQCLQDYDIPLHLSHSVTKVHGKYSLEGVTVMELNEEGKPVAGTEKYIECDLLVLAVGLIPENELSSGAGIKLDPARNAQAARETALSTDDSRVRIMVIPTNEELIVARQTRDVLTKK